MKKTLLAITIFLLCAGAAQGQVGYIQLSISPSYVDCQYVDLNPSNLRIYAVHRLTAGTTNSRWMLRPGATFSCLYMGETIEVSAYSGSTQTGLMAIYPGCQTSDVLVASIDYYCLGTSPDCAFISVVGDPRVASGEIEIADCQDVIHYAVRSHIIMNDFQGTCGLCSPSAAETTSWGRVKTLYR